MNKSNNKKKNDFRGLGTEENLKPYSNNLIKAANEEKANNLTRKKKNNKLNRKVELNNNSLTKVFKIFNNDAKKKLDDMESKFKHGKNLSNKAFKIGKELDNARNSGTLSPKNFFKILNKSNEAHNEADNYNFSSYFNDLDPDGSGWKAKFMKKKKNFNKNNANELIGRLKKTSKQYKKIANLRNKDHKVRILKYLIKDILISFIRNSNSPEDLYSYPDTNNDIMMYRSKQYNYIDEVKKNIIYPKLDDINIREQLFNFFNYYMKYTNYEVLTNIKSIQLAILNWLKVPHPIYKDKLITEEEAIKELPIDNKQIFSDIYNESCKEIDSYYSEFTGRQKEEYHRLGLHPLYISRGKNLLFIGDILGKLKRLIDDKKLPEGLTWKHEFRPGENL